MNKNSKYEKCLSNAKIGDIVEFNIPTSFPYRSIKLTITHYSAIVGRSGIHPVIITSKHIDSLNMWFTTLLEDGSRKFGDYNYCIPIHPGYSSQIVKIHKRPLTK